MEGKLIYLLFAAIYALYQWNASRNKAEKEKQKKTISSLPEKPKETFQEVLKKLQKPTLNTKETQSVPVKKVKQEYKRMISKYDQSQTSNDIQTIDIVEKEEGVSSTTATNIKEYDLIQPDISKKFDAREAFINSTIFNRVEY